MAGRRPPRRQVTYLDLTDQAWDAPVPDLRVELGEVGTADQAPRAAILREGRGGSATALARPGLRRWSAPIQPAPTRRILDSAPRPARLGRIHAAPASHEVLRYVFMDPGLAQRRLAAWWPVRVDTSRARFDVVDRGPSWLRGVLHRTMRRRLDVVVSVEGRSPALVCVRLTPDLRGRRYNPPTDTWWRVAHPIVNAVVEALTDDTLVPV